jgi:hypothetical protein
MDVILPVVSATNIKEYQEIFLVIISVRGVKAAGA